MMQGTYASFWSPALPTVEGPDSSGSLSPSLVISTRPLSARWWRRMEDEGKIGRLIEIIMWCTSVTVVSRVPQCLSHAGRCVSFHSLVPIMSGRIRQLELNVWHFMLSKTVHLNADLFLFALAQNFVFFHISVHNVIRPVHPQGTSRTQPHPRVRVKASEINFTTF